MLLIVTVGWRMTCVVGGIVMIVIGFPLVHFFVKKHGPEHYGLLPDGAKAEIGENGDTIDAVEKYALEAGEVDFTLQEAFRTKAFWMIIIAYSFHGALYPVMNIHCIPFLTDMGMAETRAAATMAFYVTSSIPARFLGGLIVDRTSTNNIRFYLAAAFMLQAIGVTLFLFNQQSMFILYTFFFLYGIGMGAAMPMTPVMRARYFGRRHFGKIAGFSRALNMPIGFMGPIAAGWIFDASGSYILAFILLAILLAVSSFIIAIATPPKLHNAKTH
jgi:cyanate permease